MYWNIEQKLIKSAVHEKKSAVGEMQIENIEGMG